MYAIQGMGAQDQLFPFNDVMDTLLTASELEDLESAINVALEFGEKIVLCDTDGIATPLKVKKALEIAYRLTDCVALHLHHSPYLFDNIRMAYECGVREFDSSIGGLGGCPFVPGSGANLATEDLILWCFENDIECDTDVKSLKKAIDMAHRIKYPNKRNKIRFRLRKAKIRLKEAFGI